MTPKNVKNNKYDTFVIVGVHHVVTKHTKRWPKRKLFLVEELRYTFYMWNHFLIKIYTRLEVYILNEQEIA